MATMESQLRSVVKFIATSIGAMPRDDPHRTPLIAAQLQHILTVFKNMKVQRDDATHTLTYVGHVDVAACFSAEQRAEIVAVVISKMNMGGSDANETSNCCKGQTMLHFENYVSEKLWAIIEDTDVSLSKVYDEVAQHCFCFGFCYISEASQKRVLAVVLACRKKLVDATDFHGNKKGYETSVGHEAPRNETIPVNEGFPNGS